MVAPAQPRTLIAPAFVLGWWLYRRHGAGACETFAQWASSTQPKAADVLRKIMAMPASMVR